MASWKQKLQADMPPLWADQIDDFEAQIRLRKAIVFALGTNSMTDSWSTIVQQIRDCRHERDGAQQLQQLTVAEMAEYTHKLADAQALLEVLRAQARVD